MWIRSGGRIINLSMAPTINVVRDQNQWLVVATVVGTDHGFIIKVAENEEDAFKILDPIDDQLQLYTKAILSLPVSEFNINHQILN